MGVTTEAAAFLDSHPRRKNKALLLDNIIVSSETSFNVENVARHAGKHLADVVERKSNKYRGTFLATYSLLSLAMPTCGETDSDG